MPPAEALSTALPFTPILNIAAGISTVPSLYIIEEIRIVLILVVVDRSRDFLRIPVISRRIKVCFFLNTNSSVDLNFHLCVLSADTSDSGLLIGHLNAD